MSFLLAKSICLFKDNKDLTIGFSLIRFIFFGQEKTNFYKITFETYRNMKIKTLPKLNLRLCKWKLSYAISVTNKHRAGFSRLKILR